MRKTTSTVYRQCSRIPVADNLAKFYPEPSFVRMIRTMKVNKKGAPLSPKDLRSVRQQQYIARRTCAKQQGVTATLVCRRARTAQTEQTSHVRSRTLRERSNTQCTHTMITMQQQFPATTSRAKTPQQTTPNPSTCAAQAAMRWHHIPPPM